MKDKEEIKPQAVAVKSTALQVKVKKLSPEAVLPKYAKPGDAAMDLVATSYKYEAGRHVYGTSLAFEIPRGFVGLIFPRSSIANVDMRLSNCVGLIDSSYRGEIMAKFESKGMALKHQQGGSEAKPIYQVGERVMQILILPYPEIELVEADELSTTERGDGGFGHSGK